MGIDGIISSMVFRCPFLGFVLIIGLLTSISVDQSLGYLVRVDGLKATTKGPFIDSARFIQYLDDNTALQEMKREWN